MFGKGIALRGRTLLVFLFFFASIAAIARADGTEHSLDELLDRYRTEPNNALLCEQIGLAYARAGDFNNAVNFLQSAVRLNTGDIPSRKNLATVLWFAGRKSQSIDIFKQLERRIPDDPVPQLYLALHAYEHRDFQQAANYFEHAGTLASQNPEVAPLLVETYLSAGRLEKAREAIRLELAERPDSVQLLLELGLSYALQGDFKSARQHFLRANAAEPRSLMPLLALGITDLQTGSAARAAEYFQKGRLIAPNDYRAYYLLAIALKHSPEAGDPETLAEELSELKRAAALDPRQASTWTALGEAEVSAGHDAKAEIDFHKALDIQPDEPSALYKLAQLYRRQGKAREAEALLSAFRESKRKAHAGDIDLTALFRNINSKQ